MAVLVLSADKSPVKGTSQFGRVTGLDYNGKTKAMLPHDEIRPKREKLKDLGCITLHKNKV